MINNQCELNFIQDIARLRYFLELICEENLQLFHHLDSLITTLSVNIYDGKRQVLINENVKETLEWQDLTGNIKLVNHYLNEIIRVFERLSYYII